MFRLLNKGTIINKITQVLTALVYLFVTLTAHLNHTCNHCEKNLNCHCDRPEYCSIAGNHTDTQPEAALKQDITKAQNPSHSGICMACMYSITSKFTQVNTTKFAVTVHFYSSPLLPSMRIAKQSEWCSSVFLRAPPIINS
jgi:hypothetical protein